MVSLGTQPANRKSGFGHSSPTGARAQDLSRQPARPDLWGARVSNDPGLPDRVTSPRWTKACSYADQFPTRYFVLYFGWTFDLMSRSCTRSGHRGQRAYSCLVAAEGLCTNAPHPPHDRGGAHALGGLRCRRPHGRPDADHLRRHPRPDSLRSRLCEAVRGLSDPGFVRDDDRPASSLSGRAPTSERRPPSHDRRPHAAPPADGRRRRPPDGWRPDQTRDQPLPQTLPRP